jgi:hypothetical protein
MRFVAFSLLLSLSAIVAAQQVSGGMQEAMDCMTSLDQKALEEFGRHGEKIAEEIKALCEKGDESAAVEVAMEFAKELQGNESFEQLKTCSEIMREAMPGMQIPELPSVEDYKKEAGSICENMD